MIHSHKSKDIAPEAISDLEYKTVNRKKYFKVVALKDIQGLCYRYEQL
jgi:hypothetical protein